jgi:N-acyl-phosphatidylethanolamine-hydrolysing phospholipase D
VVTRLVKPLTALGAWDEVGNTLHYSPLNGRYLKELAIQKRHHGDGRFINPVGPLRSGRFWELLRWKISRNPYENYLSGQMVQPVNIDWSRLKSRSGLSITFIKHAGVIIKEDDIFYYIDPVFDDIGFFFKDYSPRRFPLKQIPPADHILITHGHYDHLDIATLKCFDRATHVISPLGYDDVFDDVGMKNRSALDWYETHESGKHRVTFLPSNHWTMRNPVVGPNRSLWGSYIIETQQGYTIYVSGDTAYFDGFEQIGAQFAIDLAIFNLGAYEPRWFMASSHINPAETVKAFKELKAKKLMIVHWGTFRLGNEPVHFPPRDIALALHEEGLLDSLVPIKHGETLSIVG